MNREKVYNKTVSILINAYCKKTLKYGNGAKCAVANLIAGNMGYKFITTTRWTVQFVDWQKGNVTIEAGHWLTIISSSNLKKEIQAIRYMGLRQYALERKHIASTGYTRAELKRIERAFESCYNEIQSVLNIKQDLVKGLNAVFAVLWDIHQITTEDFAFDNRARKYNLTNAVVDRLVKRYDSISLDKQPRVQQLIESDDPYDCKQGVVV